MVREFVGFLVVLMSVKWLLLVSLLNVGLFLMERMVLFVRFLLMFLVGLNCL